MFVAVGVAVVLFLGVAAAGVFALLPDGNGAGIAAVADEADDDESRTDARPSVTAKAKAKVDLTVFKGEHICSALAPETLKKLVPEAEENPADGTFGPIKTAKCEWKSGDQANQRTERNRMLNVELTTTIRGEDGPEEDFARDREVAEEASGKTIRGGFTYDELRDVPGIGEAAFANTFAESGADRLSNGAEMTVRVAGGVVTVLYLGHDQTGGVFGKRSAVSSDTMMNGAKSAAKEIVAVLAKKPVEARVAERLTGDIRGQDLCKVVPRQLIDKHTPNPTVDAKNRSNSNSRNGKIKEASCSWSGRPVPGQEGPTYLFSRLNVLVSTVEKQPGAAFAGEKKAAQYQPSNPTGGVREGPVKNVSGLGEAAFSQAVETKLGEQHSRTGQVWFLTGKRIVQVRYEGSKALRTPGAALSTTPLEERVVSAAAKTIAEGLSARIAGD
ncbi:hypothetical protein ACFOY2_19780 [Nonomuraea purpurea]|uniref:DUF3558 domain-containing protein n=1 Tax=Nonomuraea purpurea TaxID=1849276 RepID=A0ABV8G9Y2_9ACTN